MRLLGETRIIRESIKIGLLPQAARLIGNQLNKEKKSGVDNSSRLTILETELELINHELSFSLQRNQHGQHKNHHGNLEEGSPEWLAALKQKELSQLAQDLWVLEKTGYQRGGFFVEFGATDGVLLSNTWLLEKEFGWQGICAEPNPGFYKRLKKNRSCLVSNQYIGKVTGEKVEFIFADAYGGSTEYANDDSHKNKRNAYRNAGYTAMVTSISLHEFLLQHNAPKNIDYLSVDTEGSEYEILSAFPFDQWDIRLLSVEHNYTDQREKITALLESQGYYRKAAQFDDWYYKPDFSFVEKAKLSKRNLSKPKAAANDFKGRFVEVMADPLNQWIPKHSLAGQVVDNWVTLHNGHRVPISGKHAYYETYSDILIFNRGVHEPLEEFCFQEIIK